MFASLLADSAINQFNRAMTKSTLSVRCALRERLSRRHGTEAYEFLLALRSFEDAHNPLQRFQLFSDIVHRFVRVGAERDLNLSDGVRADVLRDWTRHAQVGRLDARPGLRGLKDAAREVRTRC